MNIQHLRYNKFSVKTYNKNGSYQGNSTLKMILFNNKFKLRSHAVKHCTNTYEFEKVWRNFQSNNIASLTNQIADLKSIECPYLTSSYSSPHCHQCRLFQRCTPYAGGIEHVYLKGIEDEIIKGGNIPRYSLFFSKRDKKEVFSGLSDNSVIFKACIVKKNIFNLMTCYVKTGKTLVEVKKNEVDKILTEADNQSIKWCNKLKWGIGIIINAPKKSKKNPNKRKRPKSPYSRGGSSTWKKYLKELE